MFKPDRGCLATNAVQSKRTSGPCSADSPYSAYHYSVQNQIHVVTIELLIGVPLGMLYQNERVWFLYGELGISGQLLARLEVFILIALLGFQTVGAHEPP